MTKNTAPIDPVLSVIIPLGPFETAHHRLLPQLAKLPIASEIILVAADEAVLPQSPVSLLPHHFITMLAPAGRAPQMNAGAQKARGKYLWFLHADSVFEDTALDRLSIAITKDLDALFYFDLAFLGDGAKAMRLNALGVQFRSRILKMPFGDQGFCLQKSRFDCLGGYDQTLECGEDHAFVWTARHHQIKLMPIGAKLYTSARKYAQNGWLRTTLLHLRLSFAQAFPPFLKSIKLGTQRFFQGSPKG